MKRGAIVRATACPKAGVGAPCARAQKGDMQCRVSATGKLPSLNGTAVVYEWNEEADDNARFTVFEWK